MPILLREVLLGEAIDAARLTLELAADPVWGPIHAGITYRSRDRLLICHVTRVPSVLEVGALDQVLGAHGAVLEPDGG